MRNKKELYKQLLGVYVYTNDGTYDDNIDYINVNCTFYINPSMSFDMSSYISEKLCSDFEEFVKTKYELKETEPYKLSEEIEQNNNLENKND